MLAVSAFPFLGAPTRSVFTRNVARNEHLRNLQGTMQAINSMVVTLPGFIGPVLVAGYILRTPDAIEASSDHRVFSPGALFAPGLALFSLAGFMYALAYTDSRASRTEPSSLLDLSGEDSSSLGEFVIDERLALLAGLQDSASCNTMGRHHTIHVHDALLAPSARLATSAIVQDTFRYTSLAMMNIPIPESAGNEGCNEDLFLGGHIQGSSSSLHRVLRLTV